MCKSNDHYLTNILTYKTMENKIYILHKTSLSTGHILVLKGNTVYGKKMLWLLTDINRSK